MAASSRSRLLVASFALLLMAPAIATAAMPTVGGVRPAGGQRGATVEINFTGARLGDFQEILWYQPGITTAKAETVNDGHVKITLAIAPDCALGIHDFRIRTKTGLSELRTFNVGALPVINEVEPNNDFAAPQAVALNTTVEGIAENEDVDYFVVDAKKGQRITAEVEGIRLGITHFDPYVAILDSKRFELSSSDDSALVWQDGVASAVAPADGKYIVEVRESAYAGNGSCLYRVHIGTFPRARAVVPSGGKVGETVDVRWVGDVAGEKTTKVALPPAYDKDYGLVAQDDQGTSPFANPFRLATYGNVAEVEPNEDANTATPFAAPMALNGVIEKPGDVDHFVFTAKKGQAFHIRGLARAIRSPLDPVVYIAKKGQGALAGSDDTTNPDSYMRVGIPEDGEYVIWVFDHLKKGGPDYSYRIEVEPIEAKLTLYTADERLAIGSGYMNVPVPKGGRQSILLYANRQDFGGDLKFGTGPLPAGVGFQADSMYADQIVIPVLFTAAADAAPAGALIDVTGQHVDPNVKVPVDFTQNCVLVYGQNNVTFWQRTVSKLSVAVTEEAPFSIDVVEPKVPLVQNGSMNLKVVAKRKEGFNEAITLTVPYAPPGVGFQGGVTIPAGQNEVVIPVNANGGTPARAWKIVVWGTANTPTGPMQVSSQLVPLKTATPYLTLGYQPISVEQGKEVPLQVTVNKAQDFPGEADVVLLGLPNKVVAEPKKINKDAKEILFQIKTDAASPEGNHQNLFCQVTVMENGEPIVHNLGTGTLRIDKPLPAPAAAAPMPAAAAAPQPAAAPAAPVEKPLTRLEKLRKEYKEKVEADSKAKAAPTQ